MVEIISRARGPGPQDARLRQVLDQNRATITRIADHITAGGYSASKAPKVQAKPDGLMIHVIGGAPAARTVVPRIRVSLNGRVVAVDDGTSKQIHHIGDLRRRNGADVFVLATRANGFFSPVDEAVGEALRDMDGAILSADYTEDDLAADMGKALGYT